MADALEFDAPLGKLIQGVKTTDTLVDLLSAIHACYHEDDPVIDGIDGKTEEGS